MNTLSQKAHDISFAVFRVATLIKNTKLRKELENAAIELVVRYEEVANPALAHSATVIDVLDRLVSLAESVKEMKEINAQVLRRELEGFHAAIINHFSESKRQDVDLSSDFQIPALKSNNENQVLENTADEATEIAGGPLTERQTAILEKVREIPFCRLRNLMEIFPDISERTIRNEIAVLIQNELIKRVGLGGPNSYFESMEVALAPEQQIQKI